MWGRGELRNRFMRSSLACGWKETNITNNREERNE